MARPTNKQDLLIAANGQFDKLWKLIDDMPGEKLRGTFSFDDRDKNVRDVLVHLYEWHRLFLKWIHSNRMETLVRFLPEPYNWKTYPRMNLEFWKHHQTTLLEKAVAQLKESHAEVLEAIELFTDEELFTKNFFPWTGTTTLGSYAVSTTSSHYEWAIKKLKKHIK